MTGLVRTAGRIACSSALNLGAALGFLVLAALVTGVAFGMRPIVITSGSMEPSIGTGALVLARTIPASDVEVGDVVTVPTSTGTRVTHRVVRADRGGPDVAVLTLRGDANPTPDAEQYPVTSADRMLLDVPLVGYVLGAMRSPGGLVVVGGLAALLLVLIAGPRGRGPGAPGGPHGPDRDGRHRGRRSATRAGRAGVGVLATLSVGAALAIPSSAAWTNPVPVSGTALLAHTVTKPAAAPTNACSVNNPVLGAKTLTTRWVVASAPAGRTYTYTAVLRETGTPLTVTISGGIASTTVSTGVLSLSLGQDYRIDVTVSLSGSVWTASSTRVAQLGLLGLGWSCGAWS